MVIRLNNKIDNPVTKLTPEELANNYYDDTLNDTEITISLSEETEEEKEKAIENRQSFIKRLEDINTENQELIMFAYDLGKEAHRTQVRDSSERYFEHLRSVALILIDECKIKDPDLIMASLLHDSIEDSPMFGNSTLAYSEWKKVSLFRLGRVFNPRVADNVIALTKPKIDGQEIKDRHEMHEFYLNNLNNSSAGVIITKMCDRLHNLRSLSSTTPEKRQRIIKETEEIYFPIFEKTLTDYPKEGNYLLTEMKDIIEKLKQNN